MELKTFKTNWPLRNPINILSCLTKSEKAIKGKYQKICTWPLTRKCYLFTPGFSYQEKKDGKWFSTDNVVKNTLATYWSLSWEWFKHRPLLDLLQKTGISIGGPYYMWSPGICWALASLSCSILWDTAVYWQPWKGCTCPAVLARHEMG